MSVKEYIIVDSNDKWLSTCRSKRDAQKEFREIKNELMDEQDDTTIYLYEARELDRFQF